MKRLIIYMVLFLEILGLMPPTADFTLTVAARDFVKFSTVEVIPYSGSPIPKYRSFDSNDYYEDFGSWDISLGKEVSYGEYLIEDSNGNYMKARIRLNKTGLSGYSGTLEYRAGRVEKPNISTYQNFPRYYYSPFYIFWLNPYSN